MGTKIVLMSPKEKKKINGMSMLKLKFNSYFVTAQLQLVLHAENWLERKFRELQGHL